MWLAIEAIAVKLVHSFGPKLLVAAALVVGIELPAMPLLRRTYLAFAVILLLIAWLRWRREPLARFGLVAPQRPWLMLGLGAALAAFSILFNSLVRSVATPLIVAWTGANPHLDAQTFAAIEGNLPLYLMIIPSVWLFAAFGEEFLFRGYLMTRIAQVFGESRLAWALAIVGQAVLFALAHWYQGPVGMVPIGLGAVVTGIACVAWGRTLWPAIIAHGLIDTLGFTLLYLGKPLS
jgi:membrane protease YdiL (CAAX protease family)